MDIIKKIEQENMRMDMPVFRSGDTVKVHLRIVEGEKERIQVFQGNVIRISRGTTDATFTVRKISDGVGVERIFPMHSPFIDHVEVVTARPLVSSPAAASDFCLVVPAILRNERKTASEQPHAMPPGIGMGLFA